MRKETLEQFIYSTHTSKTADSYLRSITKFTAQVPNAPEAQYRDIVEYMVGIQKKYKDSATPTRILAAIKRYYDYLQLMGERNDHPCRRFTVKVNSNRTIRFGELFTPDELELMLNKEERYKVLKQRNIAVVSLLIYQGLTIDELVRLTVNDIDLDNATVYVKASKKNARRTLQMNSKQILIFLKYIETRKELIQRNSDKLLLSIRGVPISGDGINSIVEGFKPLFTDRNLNPKTIRMSVIANWLNVNKRPLDEVQLMAGHRWPSSTERYIRKDLTEQRELINKFHPLND
ncbi:tyrosine-type recombinase/integrase [Parvicella tangerina]|uniref:Tyrosine recombinase XerC n=1 Tax=Parvicella tangerina TaxID=2829795 RepID=A0A916NAR5_9FLAO|nr:tyrosine-type recombinase/integrase [Parvicella tangerina]CAG5081267.1 Tyrosine recombinase XerC [Parvicella tangerina]